MPRSDNVKKHKPEDPSVSTFREYIRIKSVQPDPDYASCIAFLKRQAESLSLEWKVIELVEDKPIFYMTWPGSQPHLPSILLNSHMDVVPVYPEKWEYDPFSATKDDKGDIYGRGTQDMKCVGVQYIEAIRQLKERDCQFKRTLHVSFVPDEEVGGALGMGKFVKSQEFQKLNVGFALDEGMANPTDAFSLYYGERAVNWLKFTCVGNPGHGSLFIENTAAEKLTALLNSIMAYRDKEKTKLNKSDCKLSLGDVTTVNVTMINGGVQTNVVPSDLSVVVDCRVSPHTGLETFLQSVRNWCLESGEEVTYEFVQRNEIVKPTDLSDNNPWWKVFKVATDKMKLKLKNEIFPAATDGRYLRELGIPVLGFSPMNNTPILLHDHDEHLNEETFLRGIEIYCNILTAVADV